MTEKLDKYILDVRIDIETGEEHCTVLKTDVTTNMANWIEIVSAMYTHHSILEPLVDELNKIQNNYNNTEKYAIKLWKENEQLKQFKEKVFVLLDEKIKHYEHKPFSVPVGQPMSVNFDADVDRLARLSELQDLEKELQE